MAKKFSKKRLEFRVNLILRMEGRGNSLQEKAKLLCPKRVGVSQGVNRQERFGDASAATLKLNGHFLFQLVYNQESPLIPTIPLLVWERIRMWNMSCPLPTVEAPCSACVPADQPNRILLRIDENTCMPQIEDCMICWSCKELFLEI
jgi:hypothetical protein